MVISRYISGGTIAGKRPSLVGEMTPSFLNCPKYATLTLVQVKEVFAMEQFFNTLSLGKRAWVRDKKPTTCVEAGELADEYELARSQEMQEKSN